MPLAQSLFFSHDSPDSAAFEQEPATTAKKQNAIAQSHFMASLYSSRVVRTKRPSAGSLLRCARVEVFLLRSSIVADDPPSVADHHRFLSLEGRQRVRAIGNKLRLTEEPSFDRIVTSPMPAATQTAELFADRVDYVGVIEVIPSLSNEVPPQVVAPLLLDRGTCIVVVADEPFLSSLGAFLIGRPTFPPLLHAQVSVIRDRKPAWCLRPGELGRSLLLVA